MVSKSHSENTSGSSSSEAQSWFGVRSFQSMLESLLSSEDIDVDILLMLREEV